MRTASISRNETTQHNTTQHNTTQHNCIEMFITILFLKRESLLGWLYGYITGNHYKHAAFFLNNRIHESYGKKGIRSRNVFAYVKRNMELRQIRTELTSKEIGEKISDMVNTGVPPTSAAFVAIALGLESSSTTTLKQLYDLSYSQVLNF